MNAARTVERRSSNVAARPRRRAAAPASRAAAAAVSHGILAPERQRALLERVSDPEAPERRRRAAEEELVAHNMRLVYSLAAKQIHRYVDGRGPSGSSGTVAALEDLVQEGVVGLINAIRRFDPSRGRNFTPYAACLVRQRVRYAAEEGTKPIKLPDYTASALAQRRRAYSRLLAALGREPEVEELASELKWSEARTASTNDTARWMATMRAIPLGAPGEVHSEDRLPLHDTLADRGPNDDDDPLLARVGDDALAEALSSLPEREREILERRHGLRGREPESLVEVAGKMGLSDEGVRKSQRRAEHKLKGMLAPALIGGSEFAAA